MESRPHRVRSSKPPSRHFSHCGFVAPTSVSTQEDDDIPLAQLIQSLWHAGMEVSAKDEAVYETVDDNLLTYAPMTEQDITKGVLDKKTAKDPADDIPYEEEDEEDSAPLPQHSRLP